MNRTDEQDGLKILRAAYAYADALAVLRGQPPFSEWDAAKIVATRNQLLAVVVEVADKREPGPSIPAGAPAPPDLATLMERFFPVSAP
jgi:hypothetical protein